MNPMGGAFSKKLLTGDDADDVVLLSVAAPHVDEHEARRLEELQAVRGLDGDPPPGEYWYLISTPWLLAWLKFASANKGETGVPAPLPGPIDNSVLLMSGSKTGPTCGGDAVPGLERVRDYRGVNRRVWDTLVRFYGGGPVISRPSVDIYGGDEEVAAATAIQSRFKGQLGREFNIG